MKRAREESDGNSDIGGGVRKLSKKDPAAKEVVPGKVDKPSPPSSLLSEESEESGNELRGGKPRGAGKEEEGGSDDSDDSVYYDGSGGRGLDLGHDPGDSDSDPSDLDSSSDPSDSGSDSSSSSDSSSCSDSDSGSDKPDKLSTPTTTAYSYPTSLPINVNDPLPPGVTIYSSTTPPPTIPPYYGQRYRYFSKFDSGIYMTPSSWYEVTAEAIAAKIAQKMLAPFQEGGAVVLDAFCGIGGNTIQFALHPGCKRVIAIDIDPGTLWCARRNCERYGVAEKVVFLEMSFFEWAEREVGVDGLDGKKGREGVDVVFCSPPWGGPGYRNWEIFDVEKMEPFGFGVVWEGAMKALKPPRTLTTYAKTLTADTSIAKAAFLMPRTSDLNQFAGYVDKLSPAVGSGSKGKEKEKEKRLGATAMATAEAIHYTLSGKSKAVCLYVDVPVTTSVVGDYR